MYNVSMEFANERKLETKYYILWYIFYIKTLIAALPINHHILDLISYMWKFVVLGLNKPA